MADTEVCDVIVVGGGLSGLAAGNALAKIGKRVKVIERESSISARGASMGLSPTGMMCMEQLGPDVYTAAKQSSTRDFSESGSCIYTKDGTPAPPGSCHTDMIDCIRMTKAYGPEDAKGFGLCNWHMLRKGLADALPAGSLELGQQHTGYTEDADGVTLFFEGRRPLRGKLLLGADGGASLIRRQCLAEEERPMRSRVCWHGVADVGKVKEEDDGDKSLMWNDGCRFGGVVRIPGPEGTKETSWMFITGVGADMDEKLSRVASSDCSPEAQARRMETALECMSDFDPDFLAVVKKTDPSMLDERPVFCRQASSVWGKGRVTLMGDAAHSTSPMCGIGPAMAVEDAVAAAASVEQLGATEEALRRYEARRSHRVTRIQIAMAAVAQIKAQAQIDGSRRQKMSEAKARLFKFIFNYSPEVLDRNGHHSDSSSSTGCNERMKRRQMAAQGLPPLPKRPCPLERRQSTHSSTILPPATASRDKSSAISESEVPQSQ